MATWYHLLLVFLLTGFCTLEKSSVHTFASGPTPGKPQNVSKNDPAVKQAVLTATYSFNNQSNDAFFFKASAIDDAQRQIVKGVMYILEVEISRTKCKKRETNVDLAKCPFQSKRVLQETLLCKFEVWAIPWQKIMKTTSFFCSASYRSKPAL
ncbi:cystatin-F [Trichomycterus rosablanca]|uniref:cystatin-F n=1 Tax=Trichomycterus rosablanca TaxID=2290929 RepID=UPI002F3599DA